MGKKTFQGTYVCQRAIVSDYKYKLSLLYDAEITFMLEIVKCELASVGGTDYKSIASIGQLQIIVFWSFNDSISFIWTLL